MEKHILMLFTDHALRRKFNLNAAQDAHERFDLNHQVDAYIEWYRKIFNSIEAKLSFAS